MASVLGRQADCPEGKCSESDAISFEAVMSDIQQTYCDAAARNVPMTACNSDSVCRVLVIQRHQPSHSAVHHASSMVLWSDTADVKASERTGRVEERIHQDGRLVQEGR